MIKGKLYIYLSICVITWANILLAESKIDKKTKPQCGQYVVYYICQLHGVPLAMKDVCRMMPPKEKGESMLDLKQTLQRIGFNVRGKKLTWDELVKETFPIILHTPEHFIVLEKLSKKYCGILNGDGHREYLPTEMLKKRWTGYALSMRIPTGQILPKYQPRHKDDEPRLCFNTLFCDIGEIEKEDKEAIFEFQFTNKGKGDLIIKRVFASCGCIKKIIYPNDSIKPGISSNIKIIYDLKHEFGAFGKIITVVSNDPINPEIRLNVAGIASQALYVSPKFVRMRNVEVGKIVTKTVYIRYSGKKRFEIRPNITTDIRSLNVEAITATDEMISSIWKDSELLGRINEKEKNNFYFLELTYQPSIEDVGENEGAVTLITNLLKHPVIKVQIKTNVFNIVDKTQN